MIDKKVEALMFIKQAKEDLETAKYNHKGKKFYVSCFYSHQVVEKALKGYLIYKGIEKVCGYSVVSLIKKCSNFDKDFNIFKDKLKILDKYYLAMGYPNKVIGGIPAEVFKEKESFNAISLAEEILKFIYSKELSLNIDF
ncbi:MAG: HEPN domain-containing protein [Caldisericia bacterium]|nr:HEPN domain-containing protein [Caldisericia bacterium]